jgi:hypothetical protein
MLKRIGLAATMLALLTGVGMAQEQPAPAPEDQETRTEPVRRIRVLQHPYDLASFYRSRQGGGFFDSASERYPIASFYRSRQTSPYGSFWVAGYGSRPSRKGAAVLGFRRSIGENGDLYLFAPAFLAPIGPLSGAFLGER